MEEEFVKEMEDGKKGEEEGEGGPGEKWTALGKSYQVKNKPIVQSINQVWSRIPNKYVTSD